MKVSRKARPRIIVGAVVASTIAATLGAGAVIGSQTAAKYPPPVSAEVAEYYEKMPKQATLNGAVTIDRPDSGPLKVVFAGDSLTYGLYASSEAKGYRPQVVAKLAESGPVEATRGGHTGNKVLTVSQSITFPADTGLIVLALGTNDVWKTDADVFAEQYQALMTKVRKSAPDAAVICLGVWSNVDGARNYDPHIQKACEAGKGKFLRLTDLYDVPANHGPVGVASFGGVRDKFHPNDAGYKAIADRLLSFVTVQ